MRNYRTTFILLSLALFSMSLFAQNKVIVNPLYDSNNSSLRIEKIELKKNSTVLHCMMYAYDYLGGWMQSELSSACFLEGNSGTQYNLISSKGVTLDKKFPSGSFFRFTLTFEPLKADEEKFHFFESEYRSKKSDFILSDILTYKPKEIKPFVAKIKGTVVGMPGCETVDLMLDGDHADRIPIPVKNGKFSYEREFNFTEECRLFPKKDSADVDITGETCHFYIEPGVIDITLVAQGSESSIIKGGVVNDLPQFSSDLIPQTEKEKAIRAKYKEQSSEAPIVGEFSEKVFPNGFSFMSREEYLPWSLSKGLLSEKTKEKLTKLRNRYDSTESGVTKDSVFKEMMKMEQAPGFYADDVLQTIVDMKEIERKRYEETFRYLIENSNNVKNLNYLKSRLYDINRRKPQYSPLRTSEFENKPFLFEYDFEFKKLKDIFESKYKDVYPYHPVVKDIIKIIKKQDERIVQADMSFDSYAKIGNQLSMKISEEEI